MRGNGFNECHFSAMNGNKGFGVFKYFDPLHMVRVPVGDDDHVHVFRGERQPGELIPNMVEKMIMARVHQDFLFSINEIGIAVIGRWVVPWEKM